MVGHNLNWPIRISDKGALIGLSFQVHQQISLIKLHNEKKKAQTKNLTVTYSTHNSS